MKEITMSRKSLNVESSLSQTLAAKKVGGEKKSIAADEFMAAAIGDVEWLKQSLKQKKGKVTAFDKNGLSAIHLAAIHGRQECLQYLVEKLKIDVNFPSSTGWRPIHLCISNQTGKRAFQCLMYLLEKGADPSVMNEDNITPAHQAAAEGHVNCLKALIEVGASISTLDLRGHLPIDLAKLWGHRKCARILAAENWHQNKQFLAKEMKQLDKLQMNQTLTEMTNEGQMKNNQEFYGDAAFKSWLEDRRLTPSPTGPEKKEKKEKKETAKKASNSKVRIRPVPTSNTTTKPNSMQSSKAPSPIREERLGTGESTSARKVQVVSKESIRQESPFSSSSSDGFYERTAKTQTAPAPPVETTPEPEDTGFYQPEQWNFSTFVAQKEYVENLKDFYPRDEYTMQPRPPPKRRRTPEQLQKLGIDPTPAGSGVRMPKLPEEIIKRKLEPEKYERPFAYRCKHIFDVTKRHIPPIDALPKDEGALHLMNDPKSLLFRNALIVKPSPSSSAAATRGSTALGGSSSSSRSNLQSGSGEAINLEGVTRLIERIGKRHDYYPNVKGEQYDINYGQVAAI